MSANDPLRIESNKILGLLAQDSNTLANAKDVRLTSTPGDDLAEEDFADRVRSLLKRTTSLASLTICIPSMARLHPSNSLPKVLDILNEASTIHPECRLGLAVHEAEQVWTALPILNRIVELSLALYTIELSRAFFPVETLVQSAQSCGLESLSLDSTQAFCSDAAGTMTIDLSMAKLSSLTALSHSEASPGLDALVQVASNTLTHLDLSSSSGVVLRGCSFPHLRQRTLHEDLLPQSLDTQMPNLQVLILPTLTKSQSSDALREMLKSRPHLRQVQVSRIEAGETSEALLQLAEAHASIEVIIGALMVREPAKVTPAVLDLSEHLINAGPPIAGDWPSGFEKRRYTRLKSIVLKVRDGHNHEEFIASLDAPNLTMPATVSSIKKKGKAGKK